jgi:hypothetical protein
MPQGEIIRGYVPGAIGRVSSLHACHYHREWGFGLFFEGGAPAAGGRDSGIWGSWKLDTRSWKQPRSRGP